MYQEIDVASQRRPGPSVLHSALELPRVFLELASLAYAWPWLGAEPRGDGHPVLVLPGFMGGDESTAILRRFLARLGYRALPWSLGQNTGSLEIQERLVHRFRSITEECNGKISLVGQSLGGVFARELARQFSDRVRLVVTLGSPFSSEGPAAANQLVSRLFQHVSGMSHEEMRDQMVESVAEPPPVPSTAIYSRADGVVHWESCLEYEGEQAENIEILGSHTGMALNPLVLHVLADRLGQSDGEWRPFQRERWCRSMLYPEPAPPARRETTGTDPCAN